MSSVVLETNLQIGARIQGKVRDVYDLGDKLLLVSTDRISAFDWILPTGIPDKGRVLTQLSRFWFDHLAVANHVLSYNAADAGVRDMAELAMLRGRSLLARKAKVFPIECVVRGYLAGSGWKEYQRSQSVCGVSLPPGLVESAKLPEPIFTPATKAAHGHDENITFAQAAAIVGAETAQTLQEKSLHVYHEASQHAAACGVILADTKLEWGMVNGEIILVDEVLTPDSSRFWDASSYSPGKSQDSFDKQIVRNWLEQSGWDKESPPPPLPEAIASLTHEKYLEIFQRITKRPLEALH